MKKIAITGAGGMVGRDLVRVFSLAREPGQVVALTRKTLDITDLSRTEEVLGALKPHIVIHAAAFTRVDDCEKEKERAFSVNGKGTANVARLCRELGAAMVYLSTDYVFSGEKGEGYREEDEKGPINLYGESKLAGEEALRLLSSEKSLIVRTSWVFGKSGPNFVKAILGASLKRRELKVVDDQRGSPTYSYDLAQGIRNLVEAEASGVVHLANRGTCSWYEFAGEILRLAGRENVILETQTTEELGRPARRPHCSILHCERYEKITGRTMRSWQEALAAYLDEEGA